MGIEVSQVMGVPPVIIHFQSGFSPKKIASILGYPPFMETFETLCVLKWELLLDYKAVQWPFISCKYGH